MDKKTLLEQFKAEVEASGTSLTHILKMCEFDEVSNDFRSEEVHDYSVGCLNGAWWMFQRQQAKVEELQKRVDAALAVLTEYYTGSYDESPDLVVDIEQALKGDQYDEHRKKAEEAISKGASLTNHRIEL
ncbi:hypothetical protein OHW86_10140 [Acinetobacter baumannii]|nr:hypothetical protein [Acinetobacter baumannii]